MKRDEILRNCDRHSVEPVTLSKYVAEYEQMWKWMEYVLPLVYILCKHLRHRKLKQTQLREAINGWLLPRSVIACSNACFLLKAFMLQLCLLLLKSIIPVQKCFLPFQSFPAAVIFPSFSKCYCFSNVSVLFKWLLSVLWLAPIQVALGPSSSFFISAMTSADTIQDWYYIL